MACEFKDWRLMNQEEYLKGTQLKQKVFNGTTDHDHCEFCYVKFPHEEKKGYCTLDEYYWRSVTLILKRCLNGGDNYV